MTIVTMKTHWYFNTAEPLHIMHSLLTPLKFALWGHLKIIIYATEPECLDLRRRITEVYVEKHQ